MIIHFTTNNKQNINVIFTSISSYNPIINTIKIETIENNYHQN
jgi:hypothetical protein